MMYFSNMFCLWRGGIDIVIKVVKTTFHSGRLQITFTPYANSSATAPTTSSGILALREIIDIRDNSEIRLTLPWLIGQNYLKVQGSEPSGFLDIVVLNELRAPDTVSGSVSLLMYASGADDYELAGPGVYTYLPFSPQMDATGITKTVDKPIGDTQRLGFRTTACEESTGECFLGLKQLLARYSQVQQRVNSGGSDNVLIWPWFTNINALDGGGNLVAGDAGSDIYAYVSQCYAFYRGGVRLGLIPSSSSSTSTFNNVVLANIVNPNIALGSVVPIYYNGVDLGAVGTGQVNWSSSFTNMGAWGFVVADSGNGFTSSHLPYYCQTKCSPVINIANNGTIPSDDTIPLNQLYAGSSGNFASIAVFRSFTDDFQLSYFLGCPPLIYAYS
jgi:hypothetical protein